MVVKFALRRRPIVQRIQPIDPTGKSLLFIKNHVKPVAEIYFGFSEVKTGLYSFHPVPLRGALRNVPARGGDAVDADGAPDEECLKRTAKSWGSDTLMLVSSSRSRASDGGKSA
jgi:hypothetical protein